jgi:hypothetical protein
MTRCSLLTGRGASIRVGGIQIKGRPMQTTHQNSTAVSSRRWCRSGARSPDSTIRHCRFSSSNLLRITSPLAPASSLLLVGSAQIIRELVHHPTHNESKPYWAYTFGLYCYVSPWLAWFLGLLANRHIRIAQAEATARLSAWGPSGYAVTHDIGDMAGGIHPHNKTG